MKSDWFLFGLIGAVALAWLFPEPGAKGGALHPELSNKVGVALIFLLHGVGLSLGALRDGALRWPVHCIVQLTTFLVFPLIGVGLFAASEGRLDGDFRAGVFYLCALPSTVSSSVALTAVARGNVPAAVLNATLSSVLGVFLTPLWVSGVLGATGHGLPLGEVMLDLTRWLLFPLALGQLLRPLFGELVRKHKARVGVVDRVTILFLVYSSFCDSVKSGVWRGQGAGLLMVCGLLSLALLGGVLWGTALVSRAAKLTIEDRIAAMFCGSKKSLASGVPMARLIFGAHPGLGVILLPILVYHALQLFVCGWLATRFANRPAAGRGDEV